MMSFAELLVSLWFLPVTLFILLPLTMLSAWLAFKVIISPFKRKLPQTESEQETTTVWEGERAQA